MKTKVMTNLLTEIMLPTLCVMNSFDSWEIDVFWFWISEEWETADSLMYMGFKFLEATFWT